MIEVRPATTTDLGPLSTTLARAFLDDPVLTWLMGEHLGRLRRFLGAEVRHYHRGAGEVMTTAAQEGGALWAPPGRWRTSWADVLRAAPAMVLALRRHIPQGLRALTLLERAHPREPHWYLSVLGTDPAYQGKGIGSALVRPVLDRCDRDGLGAYLESSKERNILYYQRFGFTVTGEIALPKGPTVWLMWREPRP